MRIIVPENVPPGFDAADALTQWTPEETLKWLKRCAVDFDEVCPQNRDDRPQNGDGADTVTETVNSAQEREGNSAHTQIADSSEQSYAELTTKSGPQAGLQPSAPNAQPAEPDTAAEPAQDAPEPPAIVVPISAYTDEPPAPKTVPNRPKQRRRPALASIDGQAVQEQATETAPAEFSDSHIADEWIAEHGEDWRFVADWSSRDNPTWMHWTDTGWTRDITRGYWPLIEQACIRISNWRGMEPALKRSMCGAGKYSSVANVIAHRPQIACTSAGWDAEEFYLGIPGGYVDLRDGTMYERDKSKLISMHTSVVPVEGPHPLADMVIARAAAGDPEKLAYLWRWFGYMLTGSTREERFLYLHGPQGCGKGTLIKMLGDILGDYAATIGMEALIQTKNPQHSQSIAKLQGKRFVYASEASGAASIDEEKIKWLTGRDKITAHLMRMNDIEFYPAFKLLIYGNEIPQFSGSEGMERRFDLVEYAGSISAEDRDVTLKDRLHAEYPHVLHSMIRAAVEWRQVGLGMPQSVKADSSDYIASQDVVALWLEQRVKRTAGELTKSTEAYKNFKAWGESNSYRKATHMSQMLFTQRVKSKGWTDIKRGVKFFEDMELHAPEYDDAPYEPDRF